MLATHLTLKGGPVPIYLSIPAGAAGLFLFLYAAGKLLVVVALRDSGDLPNNYAKLCRTAQTYGADAWQLKQVSQRNNRHDGYLWSR